MIFLIIFYFLASGICFWSGLVMYTLIAGRGTKQKDSIQRPLISYLITGLIMVTGIGQWVVLFKPLRLSCLLFIFAALVILTLFFRRRIMKDAKNVWLLLQQKNSLFFLYVFSFLLMVLVLNAGPTVMDDTDSYHIQMIKWIQEFGTVPGIANLHLRFGFNSSWFTSIGLLSHSFPGFNNYLSLNGLLSFWFCYYLVEKFSDSLRESYISKSYNQAIGILVILLLCLINWPFIRGCATSANYDFITTFCIVILFLELFSNLNKPGIEWFLWPLYLFTIRIFNFPLLFLSLFYFFSQLRPFNLKRFGFLIFIAVFLILPFITRNIILSGYPFFPVYQLDFFAFDWKVDKRLVMEISEYIKYFNRVNPGIHPIAETRQLAFPQWIGNWFTYLFTYDKLMIILSFIGYSFLLFRMKRVFSDWQKIFLSVMIFQLVSWFFIAPDPRFVQGCLLFGIFASIQVCPSLYRRMRLGLKVSFGFISSLVLVYALSKIIREENYRNFLIPHRLPIPIVKSIVVDHLELHIPSRVLNNWNPRCYDIALPCLYQLDPRVEARGSFISDGFRLKPGSRNHDYEGEYKIKE